MLRKAFRRVATTLITPLGVALVAVHWIVVLFAYTGDYPELGFGKTTALPFYIAMADVVPFVFASALSKLLVLSTGAYIAVLATFVTMQWLIVGSFAQTVWKHHRDELLPIQLGNPRP